MEIGKLKDIPSLAANAINQLCILFKHLIAFNRMYQVMHIN